MTIRTRVALWFVLILAIVLGVFSYAIWQLTLNTVVDEVQRDVRLRAAITAAWVHPGPAGRLLLPTLGAFSAPDTYLQVRDPRGAVLASSANLGRRVLPLDRAAIAAQWVEEVPLTGVRVEVERMARMVTQLLILARSDAGASVAHEPLLVGDVLAEAWRQAPTAGSGATVRCMGVNDMNGAVVRGNLDYLKQLFLILLDNAVKYTPAGGTVTMSATVNEATVAVTVADTGIGIAAADLPHIFERFYRAANARSQGGMGLGLAIARRVAEQHGGQIVVESALGRGSRFTMSLPLLNPAGAQSASVARAPVAPAPRR